MCVCVCLCVCVCVMRPYNVCACTGLIVFLCQNWQ